MRLVTQCADLVGNYGGLLGSLDSVLGESRATIANMPLRPSSGEGYIMVFAFYSSALNDHFFNLEAYDMIAKYDLLRGGAGHSDYRRN
jgi:hypothetical protein